MSTEQSKGTTLAAEISAKTDRSERLQAMFDEVAVVFRNGADDDLWEPGMKIPQAVANLRAKHDALSDRVRFLEEKLLTIHAMTSLATDETVRDSIRRAVESTWKQTPDANSL